MTGSLLLLLPIALPLAASAWLGVRGAGRTAVLRLSPWLPLLLLPAWLVAAPAEAPFVLLGLRLAVDAITLPVLLLTAAAWTLAGVYARAHMGRGRVRFWIGWLTSLGGMSLALLAADLAGFYAGYALLSLASWLMIVHARTPEAWRAGRVYLVLALLGEMAVFSGVVALASQHGNLALAEIDSVAWPFHWQALVFTGFAVKMGVVPLHLWLPLAHPVAPVPASAILSGIIVKAGLLGWLRLLPVTADAGVLSPTLLMGLGLFTAFFGVVVGLAQSRVKVILAYSTISQMGLVLVLYALMRHHGTEAERLLPWLGLLVLHHGLNKASLFLACGSAGPGWLRKALVWLPALALTAAPLTTGMLAKAGIKQGLAHAGLAAGWGWALSLSSTATAVLLWHFWVQLRTQSHEVPVHASWPALTLTALVLPWAWLLYHGLDAHLLHGLWPATWPLLLAAGLIMLRPKKLSWSLPAGDLLLPIEAVLRRARQRWGGLVHLHRRPLPNLYPVHVRLTAAFLNLESRMGLIPVAGTLVLGIGALLWVVHRL